MATKKNGPYFIGKETIIHKNAKVSTVFNSLEYEKFLIRIDEGLGVAVGFIPNGYEHRPDSISNVFYGTPANWWLLMEVNNVFDPFEGFNVGDQILIPKVDGFKGPSLVDYKIYEGGG